MALKIAFPLNVCVLCTCSCYDWNFINVHNVFLIIISFMNINTQFILNRFTPHYSLVSIPFLLNFFLQLVLSSNSMSFSVTQNLLKVVSMSMDGELVTGPWATYQWLVYQGKWFPASFVLSFKPSITHWVFYLNLSHWQLEYWKNEALIKMNSTKDNIAVVHSKLSPFLKKS